MLAQGSIRLFTFFGINVYLHWTWLAWLVIRTQYSYGYDSRFWSVLEFLALFGIVLLHEFGHALATRSVGGTANRIVLWPLGGVAFVSPPPRPGAVLWSIAAGPLVNVLLMPPLIIFAAVMAVTPTFEFNSMADPQRFAFILLLINFGLLVFNMLPIYPLDGGQILQALLWFMIGRARSLQIVSGLGLLAGAAIGVLALMAGELFLVFIALFVVWQAYNGWRVARMMVAYERGLFDGSVPLR